MTNLFCVRTEFGTYTRHFVAGGYVAIGWMPNTDLSAVASKDELYSLYKREHPDDTSNIVLVEHWNDIPLEFQERLGLKPGLVRG